MVNSLSIRSYALTIRPLRGCSDKHIALIQKWVKKHCAYYYVITEKQEEERHIHAGLFLKKATSKSNLGLTIQRLFKDLSFEEHRVLRDGVKVMYNYDFIGKYMEKDDDTVVIERHLPEESTLDEYFSEIPPKSKKGPVATDPFYANLERLWYAHKRPIEETNPNNLRHFLMDMMNNKRLIRVIADNRKIFQISCALARYINKETSFNVEPEPFHQDV